MARINSIQKLILSEIREVKADMREVREKELPGIHVAMGVLKTQVEERTGKKATLISAVGGAIAVLISIGVSVAAMLLRQ